MRQLVFDSSHLCTGVWLRHVFLRHEGTVSAGGSDRSCRHRLGMYVLSFHCVFMTGHPVA